MSDIVTIAGSPSVSSRSSAVLELIRKRFEIRQFSTNAIEVRDLPAEALMWGNDKDPRIQDAVQMVTHARVVLVATPIYNAAFSGLLKTFLDVLPEHALADKIVFPIALGGSRAHVLAIEYSLKPVLSTLGAQHILHGLYILESQVRYADGWQLDWEIEQRLDKDIETIIVQMVQPETGAVLLNSLK